MKPTGMIDFHSDTLILDRNYTGKEEVSIGLINDGHISLDKMPKGTKWAQAFAVFVPDEFRGQGAIDFFERYANHFDKEILKHNDKISHCRTFEEIEKAFEEEKFAAILTVEGGAVLAGELERVAYMQKRGVKAITLTWNGENEICSGHTTSNGISDFGKKAIKEMEKRRILVDTSHINDIGFLDLCEIAERPFFASHSNSRTICPHKRNLTDEQFGEFVKRGGVVGLNYCTAFISDKNEDPSFDDLYRHIEHFLALGGEDVISLGSDFDGASVPSWLNSVELSLNLYEMMIKKGLSEEIADKIMFKNAYNFLKKNL